MAQETVLWERLLEVVAPSREVRVRVGLEVPGKIGQILSGFSSNVIATHSLMYAAVGKSEGSQPMLMLSGSWYTRIQSTFMLVGNVK